MRKILLGGVFVFIYNYLVAQTGGWPFIKYDSSKIIYPGDSATMLQFFNKLEALKTGELDKVTVAHFGGSHIQAGYWTEALADSFQTMGGYVGGGAFLFPYRLVKTNGPPFYRSHGTGEWQRCRAVTIEMCSDLGMCGMAAVTSDSTASFGFQLRPNEHIQSFHYIKVYHNFNPDYVLSLEENFPVEFQRRDYPEQGYSQFHFAAPIDSIHFEVDRIGSKGSNFMLRGCSVENENPGVYFASIGVNGASTRSYIHCNEFEKEIATIKPDLFIFSIGVNDVQDADFIAADYFARYDSLVAIARKVSPDCAILFTTITDNYIRRKTKNTRTVKGNEQIMALAAKNGAGVWDMFTVMGGLGSIDRWYRNGMAASDRIHFNSKGYYLLAGLMFNALHESYLYNYPDNQQK